MNTKVQGLLGGCIAILAMMSLATLLGMPSPVQAQNKTQKCTVIGGISGCYNCGPGPSSPTATAQGCNGTTTPPAGYVVGQCINQTGANTCTGDIMDCGKWIYCSNGNLTGQKCSQLPICV